MRFKYIAFMFLAVGVLLTHAARADDFYDYLKDEFAERHAVAPDLPVFKNPMFNGDFIGLPTRHTKIVQLYPDGPVDPYGRVEYGPCALIVNETDRIVFKCLHNNRWRTHHYLNISDPYMHRGKNDTNCYIVEQTCYEDSCEYYQPIFYRPAPPEGCGPAAPRDEWLRSTVGDGDTFLADDACDQNFERDQQLRRQLSIPFQPCFREKNKTD